MGKSTSNGKTIYIRKGETKDDAAKRYEGKGNQGISANLPELTGSEKQVAWASNIRQNYIDDVNRRIQEGNLEFEDLYSAYYNGTGAMTDRMKDGNGNLYTNQYTKQLREITGNAERATREQRDKAEDYVYQISEKADEAGREAYNSAKAQGKSKEEQKNARKMAKSKVFAQTYKSWVEQDLSLSTSASMWIDRYKGTKYSQK